MMDRLVDSSQESGEIAEWMADRQVGWWRVGKMMDRWINRQMGKRQVNDEANVDDGWVDGLVVW